MKRALDADDRTILGRLLLYSLLLLCAAIVLGLAVRLFLLVAFGYGLPG